MRTTPRKTIAAAVLMLFATNANAALVPVWFDGFDVSQSGGTSAGASSFNINEEVGPPRQGGPLVPTTYSANTADPSNDFRHQLFPPSNGFQPLQLAGDGFLPGAAPIMVSPNQDFSGLVGSDVLGKRITFSLDVSSFTAGDPNNAFLQAGITLGASSQLLQPDAVSGGQFGIAFVEDTIGGAGNGAFLQFFDNGVLVQNLIPNPAGFGNMNVEIDIEDPVDLNPWDGVGVTQVSVLVNGTPVGSPHTIGGGGLTSNFVTLSATRDFVSNQLATHVFDNLTVFSGPPIPEPSTLGIAIAGVLIASVKRRS